MVGALAFNIFKAPTIASVCTWRALSCAFICAFAIDSYNAIKDAEDEVENGDGADGVGGVEDYAGEARDHSPSIVEAAARLQPVVPVRLKLSSSLKYRLRNINSPAKQVKPRTLIATSSKL